MKALGWTHPRSRALRIVPVVASIAFALAVVSCALYRPRAAVELLVPPFVGLVIWAFLDVYWRPPTGVGSDQKRDSGQGEKPAGEAASSSDGEAGFTTFELLVVIVILGLLIAIPSTSSLGFKKPPHHPPTSDVRLAVVHVVIHRLDSGGFEVTGSAQLFRRGHTAPTVARIVPQKAHSHRVSYLTDEVDLVPLRAAGIRLDRALIDPDARIVINLINLPSDTFFQARSAAGTPTRSPFGHTEDVHWELADLDHGIAFSYSAHHAGVAKIFGNAGFVAAASGWVRWLIGILFTACLLPFFVAWLKRKLRVPLV
jgi:hypothetical protein